MSCKRELCLSFALLSFQCGRLRDHFNLFNIQVFPPSQKIFVIILSFPPPPLFCSFYSPVGYTGKCFYYSPTSFLYQSLLCSPLQTPPQTFFPLVAQTCSAQEPGTSCVVKAMVASFICGALRVRSRLRLSPQHWADLCSLQPQSEGGRWGRPRWK